MRKGSSQTPQFVDHGQVSFNILIYKMMIKTIIASKINNSARLVMGVFTAVYRGSGLDVAGAL